MAGLIVLSVGLIASIGLHLMVKWGNEKSEEEKGKE